jgi:hypothetical protein
MTSLLTSADLLAASRMAEEVARHAKLQLVTLSFDQFLPIKFVSPVSYDSPQFASDSLDHLRTAMHQQSVLTGCTPISTVISPLQAPLIVWIGY